MNGRVKLATSTQILALSVVWLALCMGIDYRFNRHLWAGTSAPPPVTVPLSLRIDHLCCSGCLDDVQEALHTLPWLANAAMTVRERKLPTQAQAEAAGPAGDYGGWLDIAVNDVERIDFVAIAQALRAGGFTASQMQFGGPRHFRFEAGVRHLCCGMCKDACERLPELARTRQSGRLRWLDSVSAERATSRVIFHARYQEPDARVDVAELLAALDAVGLPASTLRVVVGGEQTASAR